MHLGSSQISQSGTDQRLVFPIDRVIPTHMGLTHSLAEVSVLLGNPRLNGCLLIGCERHALAHQVETFGSQLLGLDVGSHYLSPPDVIKSELEFAFTVKRIAHQGWIDDMVAVAATVIKTAGAYGAHFLLKAGTLADINLDSLRGRHIDYVKLGAIVTYIGESTRFFDTAEVDFDGQYNLTLEYAGKNGACPPHFKPFRLGVKDGAKSYAPLPGEVLFFRGSEADPKGGLVHSSPIYEKNVDPLALRVVFTAFVPESH